MNLFIRIILYRASNFHVWFTLVLKHLVREIWLAFIKKSKTHKITITSGFLSIYVTDAICYSNYVRNIEYNIKINPETFGVL